MTITCQLKIKRKEKKRVGIAMDAADQSFQFMPPNK